jgi:2,4-dienoyl-CoA reductase-like NADH-dependent reductase (Old Yellow Enzyme family)
VLPNGVVVPNRLVKAAMEEGITGGLPGKRHRRLYRTWGRGGWGAVLTGGLEQTLELVLMLEPALMFTDPQATSPSTQPNPQLRTTYASRTHRTRRPCTAS